MRQEKFLMSIKNQTFLKFVVELPKSGFCFNESHKICYLIAYRVHGIWLMRLVRFKVYNLLVLPLWWFFFF